MEWRWTRSRVAWDRRAGHVRGRGEGGEGGGRRARQPGISWRGRGRHEHAEAGPQLSSAAESLPTELRQRDSLRPPADAVMHGLDYIYLVSCDAHNFERFGTGSFTVLMTCAVRAEPVRAHCLKLLKNTAYRWRNMMVDLPGP